MPFNSKSLQNLRQNRPNFAPSDDDCVDFPTDLAPISESGDIAAMAGRYAPEALETIVRVMRGKTSSPAVRVSAASRILSIAQGDRDRSQVGEAAFALSAMKRISAALEAASLRRAGAAKTLVVLPNGAGGEPE